jgi:signal transduction histidine kinase
MYEKQPPMILIVDDNSQNLSVLGNMLREHGYHFVLAETGHEALEFVEKKIPDLILLDIMMPEMNGLEVCKRLKQEPAFSDIPVIFLTAKRETEDIIKGFKLGAVDYVTKPFNKEELMVRVSTRLELKEVREKLRQALATKDKFFSIIAHDLMTPFNALLGFSSLLLTEAETLSANERQEFIQDIQQASIQGHNLLTNLLFWASSQTGKLEVNPITFDLEDVVKENVELLSENAKHKGINLLLSIENQQIFADKNMLDAVIRNLLSNAIKFTPTNGTIEISSKKEGNAVEISISDTGVGISAEDIDKLFKIDVNHTTVGTQREKGTGLGLILCKEFVEKQGGTIKIDSEKGKGSRFSISLPSS